MEPACENLHIFDTYTFHRKITTKLSSFWLLFLTSSLALHIVNIYGENIPMARKKHSLFRDELTHTYFETEHAVKFCSFTRHIA
jgi:hypothetical protein